MKWETDKENNISTAGLRNQQNIEFIMEHEAGRDRQGPEHERHERLERPGAMPSDPDLML